MMPKGVEHPTNRLQQLQRRTEVRIPMMPKGVEHSRVTLLPISLSMVRIPMMPKGVEHNQTATYSLMVRL